MPRRLNAGKNTYTLARFSRRPIVSRLLGWVSVLVVGAVVFGSGRVSAAPDPTEDELIRKGVEARRRRDDVAALDLFKQAYALHHSPRSAAQMGLAEIALGRWVDADAHLEEATAAATDPWIKKNAKTLEDSLARVQQEVGTLSILGSPDGAEIVISGEVRGTLPLDNPIRVRAGEVRFELRSPGHETETRTVRVLPGQLTRESVTLALLPPVVARPPTEPAPSVASRPGTPGRNEASAPAGSAGGTLRMTGLILAGAGVVAVAVGIGFGSKARAAGEADSKAPTFDPSAESMGHRYQTLQWVGYGVGGALIASGIATFLVGRSLQQGRDPGFAASFVPATGGGVGMLRWKL
jgi:hypothetical protein